MSYGDDRWREQCSARGPGLSHVHSKGYCLFCGADPTAPWPDPEKITGEAIRRMRPTRE